VCVAQSSALQKQTGIHAIMWRVRDAARRGARPQALMPGRTAAGHPLPAVQTKRLALISYGFAAVFINENNLL
jgi:hypothetical protein